MNARSSRKWQIWPHCDKLNPHMAKPHESNKATYDAVILAVACGETIASFCARTGTNRSTITKWQADPAFDREVTKARRRMLDKAVGRLTSGAEACAVIILKVATQATSDRDRLAASRAALEELRAMTGFTQLDDRIQELERRFEEQQQRAHVLPIAGHPA
jgi:hypothetical protein